MKFKVLLASLMLSLGVSAFAQTSALFVKDGNKLININKFLEDDSVSDDTVMCYKGDANKVMSLIKKLAKENENFFCDGCGGGFAFRSVKLIRGIVTYDLLIKVEDEVVPGEFRTNLVKPCK